MASIKLTSADAKKIYYDMALVRKFEEKSIQLYGMGYIAGFFHAYIGQEAIATGFNFLKKPQDSHITSYRCHAHALLQGELNANEVMAELTGRSTGSSHGKGGSMHIYSKEHNFFGGNGIVGAQVPLGAGAAFAHKYKKDGGVCVAYLGDGAMPQGQVYEAFNLASLMKLPLVIVVENNGYSMGTSLERTHANTNLSLRGEPFNIPGEKVDGMDILDVLEKGSKAIDYARNKGPYLLEAITYRYRGHSMSDPQKYRSKEEVEKMRNNFDPIDNFVKYALSKKLLNEADIKEMDKQIKDIVNKAEEFSLNSPEPDLSELYTNVLL
jgi:pyruvate dehydrogenase E1 component alpha subunit